MNIPLDRLYHYVRDVAQEIYDDRVIIYRFWPHGSKNINDLNNLNEDNDESLGANEWYKKIISPMLWCNDQEPLDYKYYKTNLRLPTDDFVKLLKSIDEYIPPTNLNYYKNIFEKGLLLHSEKRSDNLKKYQIDNELIPVYYWNHAIIARDWFRYAEHETFHKNAKKLFLIYNRAWSGTREYRLRFSELIISLGLEQNCQMSVSPIDFDLGIHYNQHKFTRSAWQPTQILENYFPLNNTPSYYSADFNTTDYNSTDIEVVLETLFDDSRLHLTEKSVRPIACAQPFILAGTHGSLEYLRSYGFKTFGDIWDEGYDQIEDPEQRLEQIARLMQQIADWNPNVRKKKLAEARVLAEYNRRWFFSQDFFDLITNELKTNLKLAFKELDQGNNYTSYMNRWQKLLAYPKINEYLTDNQNTKYPTQAQVKWALELIQHKLNNKK